MSRFTLDKRWLRGGGCSSSKMKTLELQMIGTDLLQEGDPHPLFGPPEKTEAFDRVDVDSSGTVSKEEFLAATLQTGLPISELLQAWDSMAGKGAGTPPPEGATISKRAFSIDQWPAIAKALQQVRWTKAQPLILRGRKRPFSLRSPTGELSLSDIALPLEPKPCGRSEGRPERRCPLRSSQRSGCQRSKRHVPDHCGEGQERGWRHDEVQVYARRKLRLASGERALRG